MAKLKEGGIAPGFELEDQNGKMVKLSDFKGSKVLVYFYPKAGTPGCTKQACSVRDNLGELSELGIEAIGISGDAVKRQKKFDDKNGLGFRLLSDSEVKVANAWGVLGEKSMYGKRYIGIIRSAFLIDEEGKVEGAWYKIKPLETVEKVLASVKGGVG